jgi:hypothetical protein
MFLTTGARMTDSERRGGPECAVAVRNSSDKASDVLDAREVVPRTYPELAIGALDERADRPGLDAHLQRGDLVRLPRPEQPNDVAFAF